MTSGPSQHASGPSQRQSGLTIATPVSPVTTRGVFGLADTALYSRMSLLAGFSGAGTTPWGTKPPLRVPEPPEQVPVDAAVTTTTNPRTPGFTGRSRVTRNVTYGYVLRFPT